MEGVTSGDDANSPPTVSCRSSTLTQTLAVGLSVPLWLRFRAVASLAEDPEFHISRVLEPGDLEIIHNPTIFHARSDIHDGEARALTLHPTLQPGHSP